MKTENRKRLVRVCSVAGILMVFVLAPLIVQATGFQCRTLDSHLMSALYWVVAVIAVCPVLFGKWKFSCAVLLGVFLGVLLGEIFGPNPQGAELGFGHYGWVIWTATVLASLLLGVALQVTGRRSK